MWGEKPRRTAVFWNPSVKWRLFPFSGIRESGILRQSKKHRNSDSGRNYACGPSVWTPSLICPYIRWLFKEILASGKMLNIVLRCALTANRKSIETFLSLFAEMSKKRGKSSYGLLKFITKGWERNWRNAKSSHSRSAEFRNRDNWFPPKRSRNQLA